MPTVFGALIRDHKVHSPHLTATATKTLFAITKIIQSLPLQQKQTNKTHQAELTIMQNAHSIQIQKWKIQPLQKNKNKKLCACVCKCFIFYFGKGKLHI